MVVPYVLLVGCGFFLAILMYWVRRVRARPKAYAFRVAIAFFLYFMNLLLVFVYGEIRLGIQSATEVMEGVPVMLFVFAAVCVGLYFGARRRSVLARPLDGR